MDKKYTHLTMEHRVAIAWLLARGISKTKIAKQLKVHRSTIYREIKRADSSSKCDNFLNFPNLFLITVVITHRKILIQSTLRFLKKGSGDWMLGTKKLHLTV